MTTPDPGALELSTLVEQRFAQSMAVPEAFFAREEEQIARACWAMARRFQQGGRLLAFGNGAAATDAQHVAVEFVHPVIVGKRALPALALSNASADSGSTSPFAHRLQVLGRPQDIAMGFSLADNCANVLAGIAEAKRMGMLTLCLTGESGELTREIAPDFLFRVSSRDPLAVQETHETLYHILWELVHIFFEHAGLLSA